MAFRQTHKERILEKYAKLIETSGHDEETFEIPAAISGEEYNAFDMVKQLDGGVVFDIKLVEKDWARNRFVIHYVRKKQELGLRNANLMSDGAIQHFAPLCEAGQSAQSAQNALTRTAPAAKKVRTVARVTEPGEEDVRPQVGGAGRDDFRSIAADMMREMTAMMREMTTIMRTEMAAPPPAPRAPAKRKTKKN